MASPLPLSGRRRRGAPDKGKHASATATGRRPIDDLAQIWHMTNASAEQPRRSGHPPGVELMAAYSNPCHGASFTGATRPVEGGCG